MIGHDARVLDARQDVVGRLVGPLRLEQARDDLVDHGLPGLLLVAVAGELLDRRRVQHAVDVLWLEPHDNDDLVGAADCGGHLDLDGEGVRLLQHQDHGVAQETCAEDRITDLQRGAPLVGAGEGVPDDVAQTLTEGDLAIVIALDEGIFGDVHPLGRAGLGKEHEAPNTDADDRKGTATQHQHCPDPPGHHSPVPGEGAHQADGGDDCHDAQNQLPLDLLVLGRVGRGLLPTTVTAAVATVRATVSGSAHADGTRVLGLSHCFLLSG